MNPVFEQRRHLIPFRATLLSQIFTDVLVIGNGVAGMRAAIEASKHSDVIVTSKGKLDQSNTYKAQGGIAAVFDEDDTFASHVADTLAAGADLCDQSVVKEVVEAAPKRMQELMDWGMRFDRVNKQANGKIALGREGGHSTGRILHADGDATGKELARTLDRKMRSSERVRLFDECFVLDLITLEGGDVSPSQSAGRCVGAVTYHPKYGLQVIWANATILASGG